MQKNSGLVMRYLLIIVILRRFDLEPSRIPVKNLEKFSRKNKQIKKLVCFCLYQVCTKEEKKNWHSKRSTLNRKSSSCRESLGKYLSLYSCNTLLSVYKNTSHRGHFATLNLCNDIETNSGPPIYGIDPTLTIKAPYSEGDIVYFW
ncbi:hypothetical protein pdam_00009182 [Pocillopora damicornis]|uniref:Uncharacterized protein n=1 Tax=Pocillopora damicornis TaxID=46731 RepID=A0A3M6TTX3_POCDA|nr:hypothetical protein pdam_00009182 [Pocillopora damicornis]